MYIYVYQMFKTIMSDIYVRYLVRFCQILSLTFMSHILNYG